MPGTTLGRETTTWLTTNKTTSPTTTQYKLAKSYPMDLAESPRQAVIDAIVDVTEPAGGQTTLTLYDHVDPDALGDLIEASANKRSHVEARFTFEQFLIIVHSTGTIFVYEPL